MISVCAAILRKGETVLLCQRPASKKFPLLWEFPGGKVERGESDPMCLRREILEELGAPVEPVAFFHETRRKDYGEETLVRFYFCRLTGSDPRPLEHAAIGFFALPEALGLPLCSADREVVLRLAEAGGSAGP